MPFLRQTSEGVILIELLQQRVQLVCAAQDTVKLRPAALQTALSCVGGGLHHKLLEILLVGSGIGRHIPQRVQNQVTDNLGSDKVNGAGGRFLAVGSADVVVLRGLVLCVPIAALVIHFRTALVAVEQPGQRIRLYCGCRAGSSCGASARSVRFWEGYSLHFGHRKLSDGS